MSRSKVLLACWCLLVLGSAANAVRVLQDPEALRFIGVAIVVVAAFATVGSLAALALVAVRRLSRRNGVTPSLRDAGS